MQLVKEQVARFARFQIKNAKAGSFQPCAVDVIGIDVIGIIGVMTQKNELLDALVQKFLRGDRVKMKLGIDGSRNWRQTRGRSDAFVFLRLGQFDGLAPDFEDDRTAFGVDVESDGDFKPPI